MDGEKMMIKFPSFLRKPKISRQEPTMKKLVITAFDLAQRFVGIHEVSGATSNPQILAMLRLDQVWPPGDETPWCGAFTNYIAWLLRIPRSKDLRARSWLRVGIPINSKEANVGFDVIILQRGTGDQPGPEVIDAPGHVGFFAGFENTTVFILGGNQGDSVSIAPFPVGRILGIRRLYG